MTLESKPPVHSVIDDGERQRTRRRTLAGIRSSLRAPVGYRAIFMIPFDAKGVRWSPTARLDLYAVGLSTLCMLHCVALPVLASLMPLAAQAAESELVHRVLVVTAIPVSLRVIWKTMPVDGNRLFLAAALVGLVLLLLAAFVEAVSPYEEPITVAGSALLCSAHLWHWVRTCGGDGVHNLPAEPDEA